MTRLKLPTLIVASIFALTQSGRTCAQTAPPAPPQLTPAQQAADSAKEAEQAAKEAQDAANAAQATTKAQEAATAAADARKAADAAKNTKDPQEAVKDAQQAITDAQKAAAAATAAQNLSSPTFSSNLGCTAENEGRVGIVNHRWRPRAGTDYFKLEYDVSSHQMRWFDYKHQGNPEGIEVLNASLLPVVYSREKVLVHVNCLHPTDTVSITTNDIALPEQGADIRGATSPSTATALAPTLDSLGSATAAGTALGTPGFGFGPPPTLPAGTTSLFTPGTSKDGKTYTDAVIAIAPEDLAIETTALGNQVADAINSYNELETGVATQLKAKTTDPDSFKDLQLTKCSEQTPTTDLPGSVCALQAATQTLLNDLCPADGKCGGPAGAGSVSSLSNDFSLSGFNDYLARTQTLVSQLNGLATGMNQAGLPARAIAIRQNMETIIGLLSQVSNTITDDQKYSGNLLQFLDANNTIKTTHTCNDLFVAIDTGKFLDGTIPNQDKATQKQKPLITVYSNPADTPICHAMELEILTQFLSRYKSALGKFKNIQLQMMTALADTVRLNAPGLTDESKTEFTKSLNTTKSGPPTVDNFVDLNAKAADLQASATKEDDKQAIGAFRLEMEHRIQAIETLPTLTEPQGTSPNWTLDSDPTKAAVKQLFDALFEMRSEVGTLDQTVGNVFDQMNKRYKNSWVDQTDALPPLTSNTIVRVGINVQRNYTPFTLTGGATVGTAAAAGASQQAAAARPGGGQQGGGQGGGQQSGGGKGSQSAGQGSSGQSAGGSPSGATSTTGSNDFTVLMEVHRFANFNLVGGAMGINAKNYSFATVPEYASFSAGTGVSTGTTTAPQYTYTAYVTCPANANATSATNGAVAINATSNSASVTPSPSLYYCLKQTQTASWQPAGMLGIAWFPWQRDYFPRGRGAMFQRRDMIPSFMVATAVTQLGSVFFGPNFEPFNGIDLFGGFATANVTGLPKNTSLNQVLLPVGSSSAAPTINTATHVKGGITFGVGFDINVFLQLFSKTQGPSLP